MYEGVVLGHSDSSVAFPKNKIRTISSDFMVVILINLILIIG
jgi:hypothetical protein